MKKISILIICALFVSLLCSCANREENNTTTTKNSTTATETKTSEIPSDTTNESDTNVAETTLSASGVGLDSYSNDKVVWGPGNTKDHQRPTDPVNLQKQYEKLGATFIMSDKKEICLTFDEGYENGYTPSILDTLKEKGIKAIFFVTYDFAKDNPDLIKRMIKEGHIIGNHTYRHYTLDEVSQEVATEEIAYLDTYIKTTYDYKMTYFRFPKGEFSEKTLALVQSMGYKSVFWSFAYADWDTENVANEDDAFKTITNSTHSGAIFLLHAVSPTNASILSKVIDDVENQGYKFTTTI